MYFHFFLLCICPLSRGLEAIVPVAMTIFLADSPPCLTHYESALLDYCILQIIAYTQ